MSYIESGAKAKANNTVEKFKIEPAKYGYQEISKLELARLFLSKKLIVH